MATALFISEQFIKDNTIIDGNVDNKYITNTIAECQDMHILPILGTALYNEINSQIVAGTVSAQNQTLLNTYIQPALKYYVLMEGMDLFNYKVTNKSIAKKTSDNSQPVDEVDVIRLMDRNKDKAEYYSQRLTNFLLANITTYTLYTNAGSTIDTIYPKGNNYTTGWNLGNVKSDYGLLTSKSKFDCE